MKNKIIDILERLVICFLGLHRFNEKGFKNSKPAKQVFEEIKQKKKERK
jgi:hypothetical protein